MSAAILGGRHAFPALERPPKVGKVAIAECVSDLLDAEVTHLQVFDGQRVTHVFEQLVKGRALGNESTMQGAWRLVKQSCRHGQGRKSARSFEQEAPDSSGKGRVLPQPL